jgi:hypothetical protein
MCSLRPARSFLRRPHICTVKITAATKKSVVMQAFLDWLVADFYVYGTPIQHGAAVVVVMLAFIPITLLRDRR